jgi:L-2-hydroxycarboxylate dehydrogenase (NAD+)
LKEFVHEFLLARGLNPKQAATVGDDLIAAELEGKNTHGLGKLILIDSIMKERRGEPEIVKSLGCTEVIDGRREFGQIAGQLAVNRAVALAQRHGVGVVALTNIARYARLTFLGEQMAALGCVGIIMNDAGPAAVAPFGGGTAIMGTNPLCFAFPGNPELIIDFSTSRQPWATIRQAMLEGRPLPANTFLDEAGQETTDPQHAEAVRAFDAAKGSALCTAIEMLCGGLVAGVVGTDVESQYELGSLIIALDPTSFAGRDVLTKAVSELRSQFESSIGSPALPGDGARSRRLSALLAGHVEIADNLWSELESLHAGNEASVTISKKTD